MRFAFIAAEKARPSVTMLCRCLRVYSERVRRLGVPRAVGAGAARPGAADEAAGLYVASSHRYGRPRLRKDLQEVGEAVSERHSAYLPGCPRSLPRVGLPHRRGGGEA